MAVLAWSLLCAEAPPCSEIKSWLNQEDFQGSHANSQKGWGEGKTDQRLKNNINEIFKRL